MGMMLLKTLQLFSVLCYWKNIGREISRDTITLSGGLVAQISKKMHDSFSVLSFMSSIGAMSKGLVSNQKFPVARVIICGAILSHTSFDFLMSRLAYEKVNSRK